MTEKEIEITISQAANILGCHPSTLRRAAGTDKLEARKIGPRAWLTTISAAKRWAADETAHKRGPKPETKE